MSHVLNVANVANVANFRQKGNGVMILDGVRAEARARVRVRDRVRLRRKKSLPRHSALEKVPVP